ncbi:MAG: DUF4252 domain-containing protein [Pseudomonadota bacterium]
MKFFKYLFIAVITLGLIGGAGYLLASSGIKSNPGYVKLVLPSSNSASAQVAVDLGPNGVRPIRWFIQRIADDPERNLELPERLFMGVLDELQGVQLRVYEVQGNREIFEQAINKSAAALTQQGWETLVKVRENNERVVIMQSVDQDQIAGISLLVSTPENAVFTNLMGPFNPESLAEIANR